MDFDEVFVETETVEHESQSSKLLDTIKDFIAKNPEAFVLGTSFMIGFITFLSLRGLISSGVHAGNLKTFRYLQRHPELLYRVLY